VGLFQAIAEGQFAEPVAEFSPGQQLQGEKRLTQPAEL